ncbi:hypothetical protein I3842_13G175200 [Carya illinoinensis]|uniref:Uncharacterized protein n=1 Tax=Carya illinoinensis TaxID=32201 RepID=A0A922DEV3_CARIL|nr:hypothetical protein I3842_13G175200 [Carya illinoinensis]
MHEHSLTLLACHSFSSSFVAQTRLDRFSMTPFHDHCDQIKLCSSLMQFVLVSSWTFPPATLLQILGRHLLQKLWMGGA